MKKRLPLQRKLLASLIRTAVISAAFVPAISLGTDFGCEFARESASQRGNHREKCRHRRRAPHQVRRGRQLRAGRPVARFVRDRCRSRHRTNGHAECCVDGDAGSRRRRGAGRAGTRDDDARRRLGHRGESRRSQDVGGRLDDLAASDPNDPADHAQLPRVCRYRAGHGVQRRFAGNTSLQSGAQKQQPASMSTSMASARRRMSKTAAPAARPQARAIRSRNSRSANTRSSPRTTRPNTTRSRAPRLRQRRSRAAMSFMAKCSATTPTTTGARRRPRRSRRDRRRRSQEKEYGFAIGGPIIQDQMHFFLPTKPSASTRRSPLRPASPAQMESMFRLCCRPMCDHSSGRRICRSTRTCTLARSTGSCRTGIGSK